MKTFAEFRETFVGFYGAVKEFHKTAPRPHRGHGLDHDVTVAQLAVQIAPDERTGEKTWCAGMLHSVDRMVERGNIALVEQSIRDILTYLPNDYFNSDETEEICQAALRHDELNQDDQFVVQQVLMDADRLANLMPAVVVRAGQFLPEIPAFEFEYLDGKRNPAGDYYHPRSVIDSLRNNIEEYMPRLRILGAKELAEIYVMELTEFIVSLEASYKKLGLAGISL